MEKVKITPKQANAIKRWVNKEQLIIAKASGLLEHSIDESIAELTMEQLVKALYIGYEVEPEFKVGDWVVPKEQNGGFRKEIKPYQILGIDDRKSWLDCDLWVYNLKLRHATSEEIATEKERRWWAKYDRNLWELKKGDLLIDKHFGKIAEVREVEDNHYLIGANTSYESLDFVKRNYTVVCFAEQRLDRDGD